MHTWVKLAVVMGLALALAGAAQAEIVGAACVARAHVDSLSGGVYLYTPGGHAGFTQPGLVASWSFYAAGPAAAGRSVTPLIFREVAPGRFRVTGIGQTRTNAGTGFQTFAFDLVAGRAAVGPGFTFGWKDGATTPGSGNPGVIEWDEDRANGPFSFTPLRVGAGLVPDRFEALVGQTFGAGGVALRGPERTYSIQFASVNPATGGLVETAGLVVRGADVSWAVQDGKIRAGVALCRTEEGPAQARLSLHVKPPRGQTLTAFQTADLPELPRPGAEPPGRGRSRAGFLRGKRAPGQPPPPNLQVEVPVEEPGHYEVERVLTSADGQELYRFPRVGLFLPRLLTVVAGRTPYTAEKEGHLLVQTSAQLAGLTLTVEAFYEGRRIVADQPVEAGKPTLVPLPLESLLLGDSRVECHLWGSGVKLATAAVLITKLPPKSNEVKIDHLSRGLIVDGLPFIPFGFYTYYPLQEGMMDWEVVNGFNLFSPYHGGPHVGEALEPVRAYLDRCAAIGMKVNYHLMWANRTELTDEQWGQLRAEIEAFRDHPALLSWYIADEPGTDRVAHLERVYRLVKELDPYHPVTIVFYQGGDHARQFAHALDIVMGDPYPIPHAPVTAVSQMADALNQAYDFGKPLWIVPQAFGGNEWWRREPTAQEQRVMTYLALLHGARGVQYFIRWPRISFPKSPIMWGECGRLALETAELTPALLSHEPAPTVTCSSPAIHARAFADRGLVTLLTVNTENRPQTMRLQLEGIDFTGEAEVLFEDRRVAVHGGAIEEPIDAFGTRAYALPVGPLPEEDLAVDPNNLTADPSYEYQPSVGTPSGCYASIPQGATCFVDSRIARHGRHSLRMIAPTDEQTPGISPFPVAVKAGQPYRVSIWARAKAEGVRLKMSLGEMAREEFTLTTDWREYSFTCTPAQDADRVGPGIRLGSAGTVWLDLFQIVPVEPPEAGA